jgi:hypothetical protein
MQSRDIVTSGHWTKIYSIPKALTFQYTTKVQHIQTSSEEVMERYNICNSYSHEQYQRLLNPCNPSINKMLHRYRDSNRLTELNCRCRIHLRNKQNYGNQIYKNQIFGASVSLTE